MMKKKKGNVLEQHAEKIVLGISAAASLGLLWFLVIGGPNAVVVSGRKLGPGEVDRQVRMQAERLDAKLKEPPVHVEYTGSYKDIYTAKLQSPLQAVPDFRLVVPGRTEMIAEDREYTVPAVPPAQNAAVCSIRGAAHVPVDAVGPENPYERAAATLGDIDLVTVQASIDVAALYRNFKQSFAMGRNLRPDWRDDDLATPVFASAQLQRRRLSDDGQRGDWEVVPRPKIDQHRARLDVPETVEELKYDIAMQKAQFKPSEFQQNILQPRPYDFASAETVWLTPSFYDEYVKILDRERREALRLERERALGVRSGGATAYDGQGGRPAPGRGGLEAYGDQRSTRTTAPTTRQTPTRGRTDDPLMRGRPGEAYGDEYGMDAYGAPADPRRRGQRTTNEVVADNAKIIVDERTKLEELREPLIFWAHDDTVEPGNAYEYRIRLGVFNPIAGKNWFSDQDRQYKDQVILWSEFATVGGPVVISPMVHFFATEVARSSDRGVTVEVAKYHMGNWRKQSFEVRPGEMIGKSVDLQPNMPSAGRLERDRYDEYAMGTSPSALSGEVDFGTGAVMVDLVKSDAWVGLRMVRTELINMLYMRDGLAMEHVPVRKNSWTTDMKVRYSEIEDAIAKPVQVSVSRGASKIDVFRQRVSPYRPAYPDGRTGDRYMDAGIDRRM